MPIWPLIIGQWFVKVSIALLDTPFIYLIVWGIRRQSKADKKENTYEQSYV